MRNALTLLAVVLLCITSCNSNSSSKINNKEVTSKLQQTIETAEIPMMQVNYSSPTDSYQVELYNPEFYTKQDQQELAKDSLSHIFQAASLSKVVFATIVLKMVEDGEIDLDTPLYNYTDIDRFQNKEWAKELTARIVLTHRSGIPNWSDSPSSDSWPTSTIEFDYKPDSCYIYSGEAFAFLQRAVEAIKGDEIEEIAKEIVFKPLGMNLTSYMWIDSYDSLAVDGYNKLNQNRGTAKYPRANVAYTLRTCANDYTLFMQGLADGKIISKKSLAKMIEMPKECAIGYADNHRECDAGIFWGLGVGMEQHPTLGQTLWHWGDNGSYKSIFILYPNSKISFIYMTNSYHAHKVEVIDSITPLFFGESGKFTFSKWIEGI